MAGCDAASPERIPDDCVLGSLVRAGGDGWAFLGLDGEDIGRVSALAVAPDDPNLLLAGTAADFSADTPGRLFRSSDGGGMWTEVLNTGISGGGFTEIAFDPQVPGRAFALPYGLIVSEDGGQTWTETGDGIIVDFDTRTLRLALDPVNPGVVYVGTGGTFGGNLYKSTDGGQTFVALGGGAECGDTPSLPKCRLLGGIGGITVDPDNPHVLYVGTGWIPTVLRSADGGATWEILNEDVGGVPGGILIDQQAPTTLYVTVVSGINANPPVLRSTDGGETWDTFVEGIPNSDSLSAGRLAQDPALGTLYVLASYRENGSLWRRMPGSAAWEEFPVEEEKLNSRGALTITSDRLLYVGGDGLWRRELGSDTSTEPGPPGC